MRHTKLYQTEVDVNTRLSQLGFTRDELIVIAQKAVAAKHGAVLIDPINAPGMFAYMAGTRAIRETFLPKQWKMDRSGNIESTVDPEDKIRLIYQNVDRAADLAHSPKSISAKGVATAKMINDSNQIDFWDSELEKDIKASGLETWFLCVSINEDDVRVELSCPILVEGAQFAQFKERIFIIGKGEWDNPFDNVDSGDATLEQDFEVNISRK